MDELFLVGLTRLNVVLSSAAVLMAFSLMAYLFVYNIRNRVARAFVAVLACVTVSYVGDVFLATARLPAAHPAASFWLRLGWLGICLVAPAYLNFGDALMDSVGAPSQVRRWAQRFGLVGGLAALVLVIWTPWVVVDVVGPPGAVRFSPGPLFGPFALGFLGLTTWGFACIWQARQRALTSLTRRRMSYLLVSVIAPLSTFPYLMAGGASLAASPVLFRSLAALGNLATATMLVLMAYSVAYRGALTPDRAVKRDLIKYLIQAPTLGVFIIALVQLVPVRLETSLGLPRNVVVALAIVVGVVSYQFLVRLLKPLVDLVIYGGEGADVAWLRRLDERLLSEHDLSQLLESILTALCEQLRVRTGCVVVLDGAGPRIEARAGDEAATLAVLSALDAPILSSLASERGPAVVDGFWLWGLRIRGGQELIGLVAIEHPARTLAASEVLAVRQLLASAQEAVRDRQMQQQVVAALRELEPEIRDVQRLRGALQAGVSLPEATQSPSLVQDPDFSHWVRDALVHYWGGPKLTDSPLLDLDIVRGALEDSEYNTARAMRAVIDQALERLKPEGQRSFTASEWLLYNILELRFVRGLKVRDIAGRLAMSESDLYRKQRVAIDALARQLATMEAGPTAPTIDGPPGEQSMVGPDPLTQIPGRGSV